MDGPSQFHRSSGCVKFNGPDTRGDDPLSGHPRCHIPGVQCPPMIRHLLTLTAILLLFVSIPAAAADKWTRVQSKNFVLVGSAAEREIRDVAENLEVFRTAFSRFFAQAKDGSSVATTVVVFKSDQAFKPFKPVYQGKPANIAGYFQGGADLNFIALSA